MSRNFHAAQVDQAFMALRKLTVSGAEYIDASSGGSTRQ